MSRLVSLIAKLHRKAQSARSVGHDVEAQVFDAKVAELCEREGLELADVLADAEAADDHIQPRMVAPEDFGQELTEETAHPWLLHLANCVASFHECMIFANEHHNGIGFLGRVTDRDAAVAMFCRLAPRLEEMSRRAKEARPVHGWATTNSTSTGSATTSGSVFYVNWGSAPPRDEHWRVSWLCGAAQAVGDKLRQEFAERARERSNGMGLVPTGRRRGLEDWVRERMTEADDPEDVADPEPPEPVQVRQDAFDDGARAAWALNLQAFEIPEEATA